jgi:hypothetical protein
VVLASLSLVQGIAYLVSQPGQGQGRNNICVNHPIVAGQKSSLIALLWRAMGLPSATQGPEVNLGISWDCQVKE